MENGGQTNDVTETDDVNNTEIDKTDAPEEVPSDDYTDQVEDTTVRDETVSDEEQDNNHQNQVDANETEIIPDEDGRNPNMTDQEFGDLIDSILNGTGSTNYTDGGTYPAGTVDGNGNITPDGGGANG